MHKRPTNILILALAALLAACESEPTGTATNGPAQQLPSGTIPASPPIAFHDLLNTGFNANNAAGPIELIYLPDQEQPELVVFRVDAQSMQPSLVGYPQVGISPRSAYASQKLSLLIGSGFVSQTHSLEPVGLLQIDGQTLSPVQVHGYTRIIGINESGFGVVHRNEFSRDLFYSALQAGPGIIERGQLDISERDLKRPRYFRSFLGLCDNAWLAGISLTPVHLRTLGEQLMTLFEAGQENCTEVVNLAGDRQAVLMATLPDGRIAYHGDINAHKVSLIGFAQSAAVE